MSRELYPLYPSNSKVIDLRSKITPAPMSKTKLFFNELQKIAGSSPTKTASLHMKKAYESERWFSPRIDSDQADTSAPPRRSMFTPSRLQLLSAQRGREMRKPYWRCPMPSAKPSETEITQTSLADIITTPLVRQGPIKPFRLRDPEAGRKTNSFAVDDDILTVEEKEKEMMDKIQPLEAPKAGFLETPPPPLVDLFEFSEVIVRGPQLGTKDMATQISSDFNKIGHGFPIYETVKTSSYGVHSSMSASISEPKSTFGGFVGQQSASNANGLSAPVGVVAEAISSSQIRLSWTDPNENAFNQMYTIKYGVGNSDDSQLTLLNTSKTEHLFEGLRPDTLYEFAVRLAQSSHWSLNALNRTFPAPPSSPPRDLTVIGPKLNNDHEGINPSVLTLTWQPPKYANGEIHEYILLYSDRPNLPDREWVMDSVKGDRLSITLHNLLPGLTYHFKLQARNVKGYGPFTPVTSFTTMDIFPSVPTSNGPKNSVDVGGNSDAFEILMGQFLSGLRSNLAFVFIGVVVAVVVLLLFILFALCFYHNKSGTSAAATNRSQQRSRKEQRTKRAKHQQQAYIPSRKVSVSTPSAVAELDDDLWLVHQQRNAAANNTGGRFATIVNTSNVDGYGSSADDETGILLIDGQQRAFFAPSNLTGGPNYQSSVAMECMTPKHYQQQHGIHAATRHNADSVETLPRGHSNRYHHNSSASLEMNSAASQQLHIHQQQQKQQISQQQQHLGGTPSTPRNPHVVYTRVDRQPIAKMDFPLNGSEVSPNCIGAPPIHNSPRSQQQRHTSSTAPIVQLHNRNDGDGYQTVGGRANAGGAAMLSFLNGTTTAIENDGNGGNCDAVTGASQSVEEQQANKQQQRMAHIVRPIVYVSGGGGVSGGASPSPSTLRSATGLSQAQKTTPTSVHKFAYNNNGAKVPVGRAMVQPRVNLASAANTSSANAIPTPYGSSSTSTSQYASVRVTSSNVGNVAKNTIAESDESEVKTIGSTKDLQEIDQMIETLQQLQHDFTGGDNASPS